MKTLQKQLFATYDGSFQITKCTVNVGFYYQDTWTLC